MGHVASITFHCDCEGVTNILHKCEHSIAIPTETPTDSVHDLLKQKGWTHSLFTDLTFCPSCIKAFNEAGVKY